MDMITPPSPEVDEPDTGKFWAAAQDHRLTYQVCLHCNRTVFYPRSHCTGCGGPELEVRDSDGIGTIYSFTIIRQNPDPAFRGRTPYVVALVDLSEGFRMLTNLNVDPATVPSVGTRVKLDWSTRDGIELPSFTIANE
jgi:hypothetical protein